MQSGNRLTLFEAASIVAGLGVGGGILTVPYLASFNGIFTIIIFITAAYIISILAHLMAADIVAGDKEVHQIVELFAKYVFQGRFGGLLIWVFFFLIVANFIALLSGYIVGSGEILTSLTGISKFSGYIIIYSVSAGVAFFSLKAIGLSEKVAIIGIAVLLMTMSFFSVDKMHARIPLFAGNGQTGLALYGMAMFSFASFFSVPQVIEGLRWNPKLIPRSIVLGISINMIFVLVITLMTLCVAEDVTEIAITGWGAAIGPWALTMGSLFILLAFLTSYWAVSYALAVIISERMQWPYKICWLAATLPTIGVSLMDTTNFRGYMQIAGGSVALLVALLLVPAFRNFRKLRHEKGLRFTMTFFNRPAFQPFIAVAYILMAMGSLMAMWL